MFRFGFAFRAFFFLGAISSSFSGVGQVPDSPAQAGPKNIVKLAPFAFVHGQMPFTVESRLGYERVIGPHSSLGASYSYLGTNYPFSFIGSVALSSAISSAFTAAGHPSIVWTETKIRSRGQRYQLQYRRYLNETKTAPRGWYLAPHVSYTRVEYNISLKDFDVTRIFKKTNVNYNLLVGYQYLLGRRLAFDVYTGLGYRDVSTKLYDENEVYLQDLPEGTALKVSSGFNLGWAF
jgi:hypothetical protein